MVQGYLIRERWKMFAAQLKKPASSSSTRMVAARAFGFESRPRRGDTRSAIGCSSAVRLPDFPTEILSIPNTTYDDQIDSLSHGSSRQILLHCRSMGTRKQIGVREGLDPGSLAGLVRHPNQCCRAYYPCSKSLFVPCCRWKIPCLGAGISQKTLVSQPFLHQGDRRQKVPVNFPDNRERDPFSNRGARLAGRRRCRAIAAWTE